jgi:rsbT antagonist protein RsbS
MSVPILKHGGALIVTVQAALTDNDLTQLRSDLAERVGRFHSQGVVIDLSALDVIDSFAARTLGGIARITRLRGAETAVVGIQPDVAFAMMQLGLALENVSTALDLEEAFELIAARKSRISTDGP